MARTKKDIDELDKYGISITEIHKVLQNFLLPSQE